MIKSKLKKLAVSDTPPTFGKSSDTQTYLRFCTAKWLLRTKTRGEIKGIWLDVRPYLRPYLRIILISHNVKQTYRSKTKQSFLYWWKHAIKEIGFDAVATTKKKAAWAINKKQLPLKDIKKLRYLFGRKAKDESAKKLFALMIYIFNPEWGYQLCEEQQINIADEKDLTPEHRIIFLGLLATYNGF